MPIHTKLEKKENIPEACKHDNRFSIDCHRRHLTIVISESLPIFDSFTKIVLSS